MGTDSAVATTVQLVQYSTMSSVIESQKHQWLSSDVMWSGVHWMLLTAHYEPSSSFDSYGCPHLEIVNMYSRRVGALAGSCSSTGPSVRRSGARATGVRRARSRSRRSRSRGCTSCRRSSSRTCWRLSERPRAGAPCSACSAAGWTSCRAIRACTTRAATGSRTQSLSWWNSTAPVRPLRCFRAFSLLLF